MYFCERYAQGSSECVRVRSYIPKLSHGDFFFSKGERFIEFLDGSLCYA